jgi:hypothetical protein
MKYIQIKTENLEFYIEIDDQRIEVRKVELADGGLLGFASKDTQFHGTTLDSKPILEKHDFKEIQITKEEFEQIWDQVILTQKTVVQ